MPCADLVFQLRPPTVSYLVRPAPLSICFESKCVEVNLILETLNNVMTTLKYTTVIIIQQRIIHPPPHRCPYPVMANTSKNPFSPLSSAPMAKKAGGGVEKKQQEYLLQWKYLLSLQPLQVPQRRQEDQLSRRIQILLNSWTSTPRPLISVKPPPRVLCHCWSPIHGKILFGQLGLHFHNHP